MKLSESITFIRSLGGAPADNLLAQWQEQARKLENRVAKAHQDKNDSEARAENLDDRLRATKAELEACRAAVKGKNEHIQGLNGQLRERDQIIVALRQEGEHLRRSISENANTVALNRHIAKLTEENQQKHKKIGELLGENAAAHTAARTYTNTIRQLEDQNKNLEDALVKAEGQVRCLQGYDLAARLERQRRTIDDYRAEVDKLLRQLNELTGHRDRLATELRDVRKALAAKTLDCNDATNKLAESRAGRNADVVRLIDQRDHMRVKVEELTRRNDVQAGYIREYQEEIRKLREQLEAEKAKSAVVAHRNIEITGFDEKSSLALCSVSSYGKDGQLLERINRVPLV